MEILTAIRALVNAKNTYELALESGNKRYYTHSDNDSIKNYCKRNDIEYRYYYHDYIWH